MNIEIIKSEKDELEVKVDNATIVELLRVYLNENGAEFAAWRREHPSKPAIFKIKSKDKSVKKVVSDAISAINKDSDQILNSIKKK